MSKSNRRKAKYLLQEEDFERQQLDDYTSRTNIRLTESQQELFKKIKTNDIIIAHGPSGSSKTFTSCYTAVDLFQNKQSKIDQIVLVKPIEESGEELGFLPGGIDEKTAPYMQSFLDNLKKIVPSQTLSAMSSKKNIIFEQLAYMRGRTFDNAVMILDEAQNADFRQLMLFITRMGNNTKVIITGDVSQYDIKNDSVGLLHFVKMIQDIPGVATHQFGKSDIVRNKILTEITDRYEKMKAEGKIPKSKR